MIEPFVAVVAVVAATSAFAHSELTFEVASIKRYDAPPNTARIETGA